MSTNAKSHEIVCYLRTVMSYSIKNIFGTLLILILIIGVSSCKSESDKEFSEIVKVSLRNVGHHLLLVNGDTTSLVKPVVALEEFN